MSQTSGTTVSEIRQAERTRPTLTTNSFLIRRHRGLLLPRSPSSSLHESLQRVLSISSESKDLHDLENSRGKQRKDHRDQSVSKEYTRSKILVDGGIRSSSILGIRGLDVFRERSVDRVGVSHVERFFEEGDEISRVDDSDNSLSSGSINFDLAIGKEGLTLSKVDSAKINSACRWTSVIPLILETDVDPLTSRPTFSIAP